MRYYLLVLKIANALLFIWILVAFLNIFDLNSVMTTSEGEFVLLDVIFALRNVVSYGLYFILYFVGYFTALIVSFIFSPFPFYSNSYMFNLMGFFFRNYLAMWFTFPGGEIPSLFSIPLLIQQELAIFGSDLYLLAFQILFVVSIAYVFTSIFKSDPTNNLIVVGSLVMMIILPLIVFGFEDMLNLFNVSLPVFQELPNPVSEEFSNIPLNDFFVFLSNPVTMLGISSYLYLEMAFQIQYIDVVTKPSLQRSDRLEAQINLLRRESVLITANAEKIRREAKSKKEEMGLGKESVRKFITKGAEKFSYVKEMIEKRKLETEEKKLISAASKTRRLGRYIERLFQEDPEANDTLTAKSSAPKVTNLALSTALNSAIRISLLLFISFIIIHPRLILETVFTLPPAITDSVVIFSPEIVIILLVPIMLLFPVVSKVISYIRHRNLIIRLRQEGRIKEILTSVGDYVKKDEEEEEKEEEKDAQTEEVSIGEPAVEAT